MRPMWAGFPITVMPTGADVGIAHAIARNTKPGPEEIARGLTWGADEKVLLGLAGGNGCGLCPATLLSLVVWLTTAFGLRALVGGQA